MKIQIAERLHPFSHVPGTSLVLPGSTIVLQIFPTLLRTPNAEVQIKLTGPVNGFTIIQDLEKCEVRVLGHAEEGYFCYLCRADRGLELLKGNISFSPLTFNSSIPSSNERLSLGSHKKQDWTLIQRRESLEEILPLWFRLGQLTPAEEASGGLLQLCQEQSRQTVIPALLNLFRAGFSELLVPRLQDTQYQGFTIPPIGRGSPFGLLSEGARLIRSLFIQQDNSTLSILPKLPPQFHAGRMTGIRCPPFGELDLEWSKKEVRRLIFRAESDGELHFTFPKGVNSFRLNRQERLVCGSPIPIQKNLEYFLDNFQH